MSSLPEFLVPASVTEARAVQDGLRAQIRIGDEFAPLRRITGVDVGYDVARNLAHASLVTLSFPELALQEAAQAFAPSDFPYVPGFLSFREIPAILAAMARLAAPPELLMVDGQGIAHPRKLGIAAHLGVLLDLPSLGVAKSRLFGDYAEPGPNKGDWTPLLRGPERIGTVLRSRSGVKPLIISPGHRIGVQTSSDLVWQCLTRYRLPEPTRLADKFSKLTPQPSSNLYLL